MITAIYARVSSISQDTGSQDLDLKTWAEYEEARDKEIGWYKETASGTNFDRPVWNKLEKDIHNGKIERLVVWRLDRLGRTAGETISLLEDLDNRGIHFVSIKDNIDSKSPTGRLLRNMLASFAQFETEVRKDRQASGIAAAKAKGYIYPGRKKGTKTKVTPEKIDAILTLMNKKTKIAEIARVVGLSRATIYKTINEQKELTTSE